MSKKLVKIFKISSIIIGVILLGIVALHYYVRYKLDAKLSELNNSYTTVDYEDFSLNLFTGTVVFTNFSYRWNKNKFRAEKISISGANLIRSSFSKDLKINTLEVERPVIRLINSPEDTIQRENKKRELSILINNIGISGGFFLKEKDTIQQVKIDTFSVEINNVLIPIEERVTYGDYSGVLSSVLIDITPTQKLAVSKVNFGNHNAVISDLHLKPKYSRGEYTNYIVEERDWIDMLMRKIEFQDYNIDFSGERMRFIGEKLQIDDVDLTIFRDKEPPDDHRIKPLYSKLLRDLPFDLGLDSILINNGKLDYSLLMDKDEAPGELFFREIQAEVANVRNFNLSDSLFPETKVLIESQFMKNSPVFIDWRFKINDFNDRFTIKGKLKNVPFSTANSFFVPEYKMRAEGTVKAMYFNFSGDNIDANGDFSVFYEDFKIQFLKKKTLKKKKFLSWFSNLFIKNKSKSGDEEIRVTHVERDPKKSFWNYFWSCLRKGLRESII